MEKWLVLSEQTLPIPRKRYRKNILKVGQFAKQDADGEVVQEFELTLDNLTAISDTMGQYLADGHKVPIPLGHTMEEDKNRGYADKFGVDGEYLYMECEAIGSEAITQFEQSECSVFLAPQWEDSEGREYVRPIRHVALTQYPVISGLGAFEAVAASLVPVRREPKMRFDEIQAALGLSEDLTEENAETLILGGIGALKERATPADPLKAAREAVKTMPGILATAKSARETKLGALVLSNKISPAVKDSLLSMYGTEGSLLLSLTAGEGESTEFDKLVLALSQNEVVQTGEVTASQPLADSAKGADNPLLADAKRRAEAARRK